MAQVANGCLCNRTPKCCRIANFNHYDAGPIQELTNHDDVDIGVLVVCTDPDVDQDPVAVESEFGE